ncbi:MAG: hypothetical protein Q8Q08_06745 [Candidatus Omnitrophota bacterium]|nr:hypothetical protein [Candidatus Omnitrophota bacterium]MDZ4241644.1 hypothetical protein [Candidatus Omnitrophota bacterium]
MSIDKTVKSSKALLFLIGGCFVILGITLTLVWWNDVVLIFRGLIGILIAVGGMLVLYMVKE